jgi:hypothetical protein
VASISVRREVLYFLVSTLLPTSVKDIEGDTRIGVDASLISAGTECLSSILQRLLG